MNLIDLTNSQLMHLNATTPEQAHAIVTEINTRRNAGTWDQD